MFLKRGALLSTRIPAFYTYRVSKLVAQYLNETHLMYEPIEKACSEIKPRM